MQDKIRGHASRIIHHQAINSSYLLTQPRQGASPKTWIATIALSLGLTTGLWLTMTASIPQIAYAETANVDLTIDRRPNETYENLVKRAEAAATSAVAASFNQNRQATDVSITVVARNSGAIAPVLSLEVNRNEWSSFNARRWITHFNSARSLLGFDQDLATSEPNRQQNNNNSIRGRRINNSTPVRQPNSSPGTNRQGTFNQPGRLVNPPTSGSPANTIPNQSGSNNPTNIPPGTGLTPQPPVTAPVTSPTQPQNPTPPPGTGLTPQPPVIPSTTSPTPSQNNSGLNNSINSTPTNTLPTNNTTAPNSSGTYSEPQDQYR